MDTKNKYKASIEFLVIEFLVFGFMVIFIALGIVLREFTLDIISRQVRQGIWFGSLAILGIILIFSLIKKRAIFQKTNDLRGLIHGVDKSHKDFEDDYQSYVKRLKRLILRLRFFTFLLYADLLVLTVFAFYENITIVIGIVSAVLLSLLTVTLLPTFKKKPTVSYVLKREDYPYLYRLVDEAAHEIGLKNTIVLLPSDDSGVSVNKIKNTIYIFIGLVDLLLINEKALQAIFYHELAHAYYDFNQEDVRILNTLNYYLFEDKLNSGFNFYRITVFFYVSFIWEIALENKMFSTFIQFKKEQRADQMVLDKGDCHAFINALAICESYQTFCELPQVNEVLIRNETAPHDYLYQIRDIFFEHLYKNLEMYRDFINKELPYHFPTHPVVKERMQSLNVEDFDLSCQPRAPQYDSEVTKIVQLYNDEWYQNSKEAFEREREIGYNSYLAQVQSNEDNEKMEDSYEVSSLAFAYQKIGNEEKAIELYKKALDMDSNNTFASFHYGVYLISINDGDGVTYIKKAIQHNRNYVYEGINILSSFFIRNGMEEERSALCEDSIAWVQNAMNQEENENDKSKIHLMADDLSESDYDRIRQVAKKFPVIKEIRIIAHYSKDERVIHRVAIVFDYENDLEQSKAHEEIFYLLDNFDNINTQFYLYVIGVNQKLDGDHKMFVNPLVKIIYCKDK